MEHHVVTIIGKCTWCNVCGGLKIANGDWVYPREFTGEKVHGLPTSETESNSQGSSTAKGNVPNPSED